MINKRKTFQRQLILNGVKELGNHPTAEQVYEYISNTHPTISRATVYRNMNQLADCGELQHIGNFQGGAQYDHNLHDHCHFVCDDCKKTFDVEGDISTIYEYLVPSEQFNIRRVNLSFNGLCSDCKPIMA
jgi:Fe2+ or Zn2+ uptake regulation protein